MKKIPFAKLNSRQKVLARICLEARNNAYAPYSKFKVGAVAISSSGKAYRGCNVESADYTLTSHAEMTAINSMIAAGEKTLAEIYVALQSEPGEPPVPCGLCRQKIMEFAATDEIPIYGLELAANRVKFVHVFKLKQLLPFPFTRLNFRKK